MLIREVADTDLIHAGLNKKEYLSPSTSQKDACAYV